MHVIQRAAFTPMRWKNGAGTTLEIALGGRAAGNFDWRLSMALIEQDCAFSSYDGYQRFTTLVSGAGFELLAPDGSTLSFTEVGQLHAYAGSVPFACRLHAGASWDLNLIARQGFGAHMATLRAGTVPLHVGDGHAAAFIVPLQCPVDIETRVGKVRLASSDAASLAPGEVAWVTAAGSAGGWIAVATMGRQGVPLQPILGSPHHTIKGES
jgi:environmental stress-induced protein Ves